MTARSPRARSPIAPTRPAGGGQPRAERTRALIMDETVRCIIEEGFEAASAKHIAERAGVTWGVIQYHFGDRAGLLAAVIDSGFDQLRAQMAIVDLPPGPTRPRVTAMVESAWDAFSTPTSRASLEILVATRGRRDPVTDAHLADMAGELSQLGRHVIDDPTPSRDPYVVGELLWAALRGLVLAQMVVTDPIDSSRERAFLVDVLSAYLDPADSATQRKPERTPDA
jgi:AcrR family transcriptional regulator